MAAKEPAVQYILINQQPDPVFLIVHQAQDRDGTRRKVHELFHEIRFPKGKAGASNLFGKHGGLELFIPWHEKQVELGFLCKMCIRDRSSAHLVREKARF